MTIKTKKQNKDMKSLRAIMQKKLEPLSKSISKEETGIISYEKNEDRVEYVILGFFLALLSYVIIKFWEGIRIL